MEAKLFPNTGHHFFFIPFGEDEEQFPSDAVPVETRNLALGDADPWRTYSRPNTGEKLPWAQWRFGVNEDVVGYDLVLIPGIWVCIETNLGDNKRGAVVRDAERTEHRPYSDADFPAPYYARSETDARLDHNRDEVLLFAVEKRGRNLTSAIPTVPAPESSPVTILGTGPSERSQRQARRDDASPGWIALGELRCWWPDRVARPGQFDIDVDLVVDFGNSRTAAVLLQRPRLAVGAKAPPFKDLVSPLRMMPRGREFYRHRRLDIEDPYAIFDSWFITREALFSHLHPPKVDDNGLMCEPVVTVKESGFFRRTQTSVVTGVIRRVPHMFVESCPVSMGEEASELLERVEFKGGRTVFMSSPKRFLWDSEPLVDQAWGMVGNRESGRKLRMNIRLANHVLSYMPDPPLTHKQPAGRHPDEVSDWDIASPPPSWLPHERPKACPDDSHHSRADTMVWAALAVLEQAHRQISSENFLGEEKGFVRRYLKSVVVTYPPGWTGRELEAYKRKWNTALDIFAHTHLSDLRDRPKLVMHYDEALGAQMPIVFNEILKVGGSGDDWIRQVGRSDDDGRHRVRVMSIDIGGGTADYSIIEYHDRIQQAGKCALECELLFKDSSTQAGDTLVKDLIEEVLLPKLGVPFQSDPGQKAVFEQFFKSPDADKLQVWRRIVRLVLIRKINQWLRVYVASGGKVTDPSSLNPDRGGLVVFRDCLNELNDMGTAAGLRQAIWTPDMEIHYTTEELEMRIRRLFQPLFQSLSRILRVFGVDMIILSGKPSELPAVRSLLEELMPLLPGRIIPVKDYHVNVWYPYQITGRIYDAKSVTASGVALLRAIGAQADLVPGWAPIDIKPAQMMLRYNCWVGMPEQNKAPKVPVFLDNGCTKDEPQMESDLVTTTVGSRIGRTLLLSMLNVEPVYIVAWSSSAYADLAEALVHIRLRRILPENHNLPEYLELTHVEGYGVRGDERVPVTLDMVQLKLCTLIDTSHWIDSASFKIKWPRSQR